jgi:hypothetical protein
MPPYLVILACMAHKLEQCLVLVLFVILAFPGHSVSELLHDAANRDRLFCALDDIRNELPGNDDCNCYKYSDACVVAFLLR